MYLYKLLLYYRLGNDWILIYSVRHNHCIINTIDYGIGKCDIAIYIYIYKFIN